MFDRAISDIAITETVNRADLVNDDQAGLVRTEIHKCPGGCRVDRHVRGRRGGPRGPAADGAYGGRGEDTGGRAGQGPAPEDRRPRAKRDLPGKRRMNAGNRRTRNATERRPPRDTTALAIDKNT